MRRAFPRRQYSRRALVETVFSTVKHKLSSCAPGHSLPMQQRQALLLGLTYNLTGSSQHRRPPRMSKEPNSF